MKHVQVTLKQGIEENEGFYIVHSLANTCQLSIGQRVAKVDVERWCCLGSVSIKITGLEERGETEDLLSTPRALPAPQRIDSLIGA